MYYLYFIVIGLNSLFFSIIIFNYEHIVISGYEFVDKLTKSSVSLRCPPSSKIPWPDFISKLRTFKNNLWLKNWE